MANTAPQRGRPKKEMPSTLIDTSNMSSDDLKIQLRNKIFTMAMMEDPNSQILVLASRIFNIEDTKKNPDSIEELSDEEIRERLAKI